VTYFPAKQDKNYIIKYISIVKVSSLTYIYLANPFHFFENGYYKTSVDRIMRYQTQFVLFYCIYEIFLAHYALATRNTDLALFLLKVMVDVNVPTFEPHFG